MMRFKKLWKKAGLTEWKVTRVLIAERMGWTLEYVDGLSQYDVMGILGVWDGVKRSQKRKSE